MKTAVPEQVLQKSTILHVCVFLPQFHKHSKIKSKGNTYGEVYEKSV